MQSKTNRTPPHSRLVPSLRKQTLPRLCRKPRKMNTNQKRKCRGLWTTVLLPLDDSNLCNILALSLSPSHFINLCFRCTSCNASLVFCSSSSVNSSKIFSWYFSSATFCMFVLPSIRTANTSSLAPTRYTGDEDLVSSLSENLKQPLSFLTSHPASQCAQN